MACKQTIVRRGHRVPVCRNKRGQFTYKGTCKRKGTTSCLRPKKKSKKRKR